MDNVREMMDQVVSGSGPCIIGQAECEHCDSKWVVAYPVSTTLLECPFCSEETAAPFIIVRPSSLNADAIFIGEKESK